MSFDLPYGSVAGDVFSMNANVFKRRNGCMALAAHRVRNFAPLVANILFGNRQETFKRYHEHCHNFFKSHP